MGSKIPEWAMTEADRVGEQMYGRHERGFVMWPLITRSSYHPKDIIALALAAAERRGIEQAIDAAEAHEISAPLGIGLADGASMARNQILFAIRQLGDTP